MMKIEIDGRFNGLRYLIKIDDQEVWLTGKSFKYFCRLAWARLTKGQEGWIFRADIEPGEGQERYIWRMKDEIKKQYNGWQPDGSWVWKIVENNRGGYYKLDAPKDQITINRATLSKHPDHGVSSLFCVLA